MTFLQFKELDDDAMIALCCSKAVAVASRELENCRYVLYQLFAFYVEAQYDTFDPMHTQCRAFENMAYLDPYLEQVNLDNILAVR